jgi:hypothetical protein
MNLNKENDDLVKEINELKVTVKQLQDEIQQIKTIKSRPVLTPALIGQIGSFILGAIVLIGIFW